MNPLSEVGFDVRVRNAAILRGMQEFGSQKKLAELAGVTHNQLNSWATLRVTPWLRDGELSQPAKRLAAFLCVDPVEAFPPELYEHFKMRPRRLQWYRPLDVAALSGGDHPMLPAPGEAAVNRAELSRDVEVALKTLTPREERVIRARFGLGTDGQGALLSEIAETLGVTRNRIMQIEHKALRKLRHPGRRALFNPWIEEKDRRDEDGEPVGKVEE